MCLWNASVRSLFFLIYFFLNLCLHRGPRLWRDQVLVRLFDIQYLEKLAYWLIIEEIYIYVRSPNGQAYEMAHPMPVAPCKKKGRAPVVKF